MKDLIAVSSRVRLARNIAGIPFPTRAFRSDSERVKQAVAYAVKDSFEGTYYAMSDLSPEEKKDLVERRSISSALACAPFGGVFLSKDQTLSVMVMEEDHIRAQSIFRGAQLQKCFESVKAFDVALSSEVWLAHDKSLGYLTACPSNVGTGMRASVMMFLPGITSLGKLTELENELKSAELTMRGALGEGSAADGFLYQISNAISLGISEQRIIDRVSSAAERILAFEKNLLFDFYSRNKVLLEDRVFRAYAILSSARLLSEKELRSCFVYVKIGVLLGLLSAVGINPDELARICRYFDFFHFSGCGESSMERDEHRAATVRKLLNQKEA